MRLQDYSDRPWYCAAAAALADMSKEPQEKKSRKLSYKRKRNLTFLTEGDSPQLIAAESNTGESYVRGIIEN